jgi:hypothetical protein
MDTYTEIGTRHDWADPRLAELEATISAFEAEREGLRKRLAACVVLTVLSQAVAEEA